MDLVALIKSAVQLSGLGSADIKLPVLTSSGKTIVTLDNLLRNGIEAIDPAMQALRIPTSVSDVQSDGHLYYRGYKIEDLVNTSYEETAYLLLRGELPTQPQLDELKSVMAQKAVIDVPTQKALLNALKAIPINDKTDMMSLLATAVTIMDSQEKLDTGSEEKRYDSTLRTMAVMPTLVGLVNARLKAGNAPEKMEYRFPTAQDFGQNGKDFSLARLTLESLHQKPFDPANEEDAAKLKAMDKYLILHEEHGHNLSSLTARIVASAESKAGAWRPVLGGLESLQGNQHGNAAPDAFANIVKISEKYQGTPEQKAEAYFAEIVAVKEDRAKQKAAGVPVDKLPDSKIPGVGHGIYKEGPDPRANALGGILESITLDSEHFKIARHLHELVKESKYFGKSQNKGANGKTYSILPNVDYYSGVLLTQYLGVDKRMLGPMFADGRTVGWQAHTMEHKRDVGDKIMRPEAVPLAKERDFIPMEERSVPSMVENAKAFPVSNIGALQGIAA